MKQITALLIDIHGQQDNRILTDNTNQRKLLDSFGGLKEKLDTYSELFREFSRLSKKIRQLEEENSEKDIRAERLKADIDELEHLHLKKGSEAEITEKLGGAVQ